MEKVFVTGATGFIGTRLAMQLAKSGYFVHALCRSDKNAAALQHQNIKIIIGDLFSTDAVLEGMEGCAAVFHVAAHAKMSAPDSVFQKINVEGTENILRAAQQKNVKRVIFTSTAGVLGPSSGKLINENHQRTIDFVNQYEYTKFKAEQLVQEYVKQGLDVVIVSPSRVFGPGNLSESNAVTRLIIKYVHGRWRILPGQGLRKANYVYVDDVVAGHILAWKFGKTGQKYLLTGDNVSYAQLFETVSKISGKNFGLFSISEKPLIFASKLMVFVAQLRGRKPLASPDWVKRYLNYDYEISNEKAIKELNYRPLNFEAGVRKTLEWVHNGYCESDDEVPFTLITGASSGIGKAMAYHCASKAMNLLMVSLPGQALTSFSEELVKKYNIKVFTYECDLTELLAAERLHQFCIQKNLQINMLINNAGIGNVGPFEDARSEDITLMMQLNMQSMALLTRIFLPDLKKWERSYILNVGSMASFNPVPYKSIYSATKSFVLSFTRSLREELKPYNVNVSCLCPGPTITSLEVKERVMQSGWQGRMLSLTSTEVAIEAIDGLMKNKAVIIPNWRNYWLKRVSIVIPVSYKIKILARVFRKRQATGV